MVPVAGLEAGQWGGLDLLGVLGVRLRALVRTNFSHTHFCINFAAKITANRLVHVSKILDKLPKIKQ